MAHRTKSILAVLALLHLPAVMADTVEPAAKRKVMPVEQIASVDDKEHEIASDIGKALVDNAEPNEAAGWSELWE